MTVDRLSWTQVRDRLQARDYEILEWIEEGILRPEHESVTPFETEAVERLASILLEMRSGPSRL